MDASWDKEDEPDKTMFTCAHCHEPLDPDELETHFIYDHPEWVLGTKEWYARLSREWREQWVGRRETLKGRSLEQFDHEFLTGCGIRDE